MDHTTEIPLPYLKPALPAPSRRLRTVALAVAAPLAAGVCFLLDAGVLR